MMNVLKRSCNALKRKLFGYARLGVGDAVRAGQVSSQSFMGDEVCWLICNSADELQARQLTDVFYELEELIFLKDRGQSYDAVLDVGANIGNHAIFFARVMGAKKVYVVEPYPIAASHLLVNSVLNAPNSIDFSLLGVGLGKSETTAAFVEPTKWNLGLTKLVEAAEGAVPVIPGDSVFLERSLDLIKIDVEGMEFEVLQGLRGTISRCHPDIFVEILDECSQTVSAFLHELGYQQVKMWRRYRGNANYLFAFEGEQSDGAE